MGLKASRILLEGKKIGYPRDGGQVELMLFSTKQGAATVGEVHISPASGKAMVIVDDSAVVRKTVGNAFLEDGFKSFAEAENGAEGIEVVKRLRPDLAILDLSMPVMNGLQAAFVLRRLFPNLPIILFSLYSDGMVRAEAARAGIDAVVSKTEDIPVLLDKAHELLHL